MAAEAAPAAVKAEAVIKSVQLDGQVLLKITQHCKEALPQLATGQLLGLDIGSTLEVTDCFPFPPSAEEEGDDEAGVNYQLEMMRCLREVNADNNTVGWYQTAPLGACQTTELIDTFIAYHDNHIRRCVCLVFNPQRAARGALGLTAIRLKEAFITAYRAQQMTARGLREAALGWRDVFQEVPIKIANSALAQALIADLEPAAPAGEADCERLGLGLGGYLERNVEELLECVDAVHGEQMKVGAYHKAVVRQNMQQAQWLQKRRQENLARRAAGEEALPEEDASLFKPLPEPSMLESHLLSAQIASYCEQVTAASGQALQKLYAMEALNRANQ